MLFYNNCTLFDDVKFDECLGDCIYITLSNGKEFALTEYGQCLEFPISKCIIFPKGKTTWEGFKRPFRVGDILANKHGFPFILKEYLPLIDNVWSYCGIDMDNKFWKDSYNWTFAKSVRFATKEEKEKLFRAIKDNGYKWNAEKKCLEELVEPKFKVGDILEDKDGYRVKVIEVNTDDEFYEYQSLIKGIGSIRFDEQDEWKLVPNKFDITNLKPFESRVLVRDNEQCEWMPAVYGYTDNYSNHCVVGGYFWKYLIPYENNEHLLGTTNDCDEYYKTWEK